MRLLAVEMGASMAYSEEMVALKLRNCGRVERQDATGRMFIDFMPGAGARSSIGTPAAAVSDSTQALQPEGSNSSFVAAASSVDASSGSTAPPAAKPKPVHNLNTKAAPALTTVPGERLVVQLGAAGSVEALAAAQVVCRDARAIDLNMGCPKHFSLQGGMGAALLAKPERAADILATLRRNINLPITCKLRLLHTERESVELVQRLERMGVSAIACHARHVEDRPRHRALRERVGVLAAALTIPLIYNGDAFYASDIQHIMRTTGARGVMVARGAMWNASIFRRPPLADAAPVPPEASDAAAGVPADPAAGMLPVASVVSRYVSLAFDVTRGQAHAFANIKYCVLEMLKGHGCVGASALFRNLTRAKDRAALEAALQDMQHEPALTGAYRAPVQLEERPAYALAAAAAGAGQGTGGAGSANAALPVEVLLAPSQQQQQQSNKQRKYEAKQKRKNREGREADQRAMEQQAHTAEPALVS